MLPAGTGTMLNIEKLVPPVVLLAFKLNSNSNVACVLHTVIDLGFSVIVLSAVAVPPTANEKAIKDLSIVYSSIYHK